MDTAPPIRTVPSRFRDPVRTPDPVLADRYRTLLRTRDVVPSEREAAALAHALHDGDPLADAWTETAHTLPPGIASKLVQQAACEGVDALGLAAPPALVALCRSTERVPAWVDPDKLRLGGMTYRRTGLVGSFVLADFALLGGYRSAAVAKTLVRTGRLRDAAAERLINTGRFVTAVTEPGGLLDRGPGYAATLRVRLMHAEIRRALARAPDWQHAAWGLPINQADMLGTNLLFSMGLLVGCRRWGLSFSAAEVEGVLHLWRYIGVLLGVEESLLPHDEVSAERALYLEGVSQPDPDADSVALARALHEVPRSMERPRWARPLIAFELALRVSMARDLLGDAAIDQLGLPRSRLHRLLPPLRAVIRAMEQARSRLPGATYAAYRVGDFLVKRGERALTRKLQKTRGIPELQAASWAATHPSFA